MNASRHNPATVDDRAVSPTPPRHYENAPTDWTSMSEEEKSAWVQAFVDALGPWLEQGST